MRIRFLNYVTDRQTGVKMSDFWAPPKVTDQKLDHSEYISFENMLERHRLEFRCGAAYSVDHYAKQDERDHVRQTAERALCHEIYGDLEAPLRKALIHAIAGERNECIEQIETITRLIRGDDIP